jgi:hypothetical protein
MMDETFVSAQTEKERVAKRTINQKRKLQVKKTCPIATSINYRSGSVLACTIIKSAAPLRLEEEMLQISKFQVGTPSFVVLKLVYSKDRFRIG